MAAEIVHDHDVARLQGGHEHLFDVSPEGLPVDGAVKDARGRESTGPQGAEEGQRSPVSMRREALEANTARCPAAQGSHVGLEPGFINKDEMIRIEIILQARPAPPLSDNIRAMLLTRQKCFF